ncbi:MAG: DUF4173 domain-containing protein, partial [Bacteroidota bacterium]
FWRERLGVNAFLLTLFLQGSLWYLHPECRQNRAVWFTGIGTLGTALLIVFVNSDLVKVVHFFSLLVFAGFVQQRELRFVVYAFLLSLINLLRTPYTLFQEIGHYLVPATNSSHKKWAYQSQLVLLPAIVLLVFYWLYYVANPNFAGLADHFWAHFTSFFAGRISIERGLFLFLGLIMVGGLLWKSPLTFFAQKEQSHRHTLQRQRSEFDPAKKRNRSTMGLRKEYQSAWILFIALNSLLFLFNLTDIVYVWFGSAPQSAASLSYDVHQGTNLLIVAILLAMFLILWFFRKNLNFFPYNTALRKLAYFWLAQNAVLVCSVGMRNYRYVEFCGLAYKRIGVFLFLMLTLYGLYSLYQKVNQKRSLYFVLHQNAWALYCLLLTASSINWDLYITRYNLTAPTTEEVDLRFLMNEVSDKNIFLLHAVEDQFQENDFFTKRLIEKKEQFLRRQASQTWRSWNWPDARNLRLLQD